MNRLKPKTTGVPPLPAQTGKSLPKHAVPEAARAAGIERFDHDALIVGSGASGISTAVALQREGYSDFVVLEAQERPFGRARAESVDGFSAGVQVGAMWEHSTSSRLRHEHVEPMGFQAPASDFEALRIDGRPATETEDTNYWTAYENVGESAKAAADAGHVVTGTDVSPKGFSGDAAAQLAVGGLASGVDVNRVDAAALSRFDDGANTTLKGGYDALLSEIVERHQIPIQLSSQVKKVRHGEGWAEVTLKSGEKLTARVAEIAVPLGVLKRGDIEFDPPLSAQKQAALSELEMSNYEKVALRIGKEGQTPEFIAQDRNAWVTDVPSLEPEKSIAFVFPQEAPDVVVMQVGGSYAEELTRAGPEAMVAAATERLESAYGVRPEAVVAAKSTDWLNEAGGSWIAASGPDHMKHRRELAVPEGSVHLATDGSGQDARLIGAVDGAWDAGHEQGLKMAKVLEETET